MNIYLVRHPETSWNIEKRFQGHLEGEITRAGKEKTNKFVDNLHLNSIDIIFHAQNQRTAYVARELKKKYVNSIILEDPLLNERNCGDFEGKYYKDIYSENDDSKDFEKKYIWKPPNGESHKEVSERGMAFLSKITKKYKGNITIICITSSGVIRNILHKKNNLSLEQMYSLKIDNLELIKYR